LDLVIPNWVAISFGVKQAFPKLFTHPEIVPTETPFLCLITAKLLLPWIKSTTVSLIKESVNFLLTLDFPFLNVNVFKQSTHLKRWTFS